MPPLLIGALIVAGAALAYAAYKAATNSAEKSCATTTQAGGLTASCPHPPTPSPAEQADQNVLAKFGNDIPETRKTPSASSVTVYQNSKEFQAGLIQRHPEMANSPDLSDIAGESYPKTKTIFINKDIDQGGTATHETIHHYRSPEFQAKYYEVNGVKINEG